MCACRRFFFFGALFLAAPPVAADGSSVLVRFLCSGSPFSRAISFSHCAFPSPSGLSSFCIRSLDAPVGLFCSIFPPPLFSSAFSFCFSSFRRTSPFLFALMHSARFYRVLHLFSVPSLVLLSVLFFLFASFLSLSLFPLWRRSRSSQAPPPLHGVVMVFHVCRIYLRSKRLFWSRFRRYSCDY